MKFWLKASMYKFWLVTSELARNPNGPTTSIFPHLMFLRLQRSSAAVILLILVIAYVFRIDRTCALPWNSGKAHCLRLQYRLGRPSHIAHDTTTPLAITMARVYADVNTQMPRSYWDYDSVNISWGVLENYEVVRKIGQSRQPHYTCYVA